MFMSEIHFFMKFLITVTFKSQEQAGDALKLVTYSSSCY